jgi:hypothetical protein
LIREPLFSVFDPHIKKTTSNSFPAAGIKKIFLGLFGFFFQ